jgi:drug/metabolite transporter (DMT)-like permease
VIPFAVGAGIAASFAWGFSAFTGALSARHFGTWVANLGMKTASSAVLLGVGLAVRPPVTPQQLGVTVVALIVLGIALLFIDLVSYRLLAVGPVAIIYPLLATSQALVAVLAIAIRGEHFTALEVVALGIVTAGVVATAYERRSARSPVAAAVAAAVTLRTLYSRRSSIVLLSLVLSLAGAFVLLARIGYMDRVGWYYPVAFDRTSQAILLVAVLLSGRMPQIGAASWTPSWLSILLVTGILDGAAVTFWALGAVTGPVAIVSIVASTYVVIPVALGVVLLGERPQFHQAVGIAAIVGGIALLSV